MPPHGCGLLLALVKALSTMPFAPSHDLRVRGRSRRQYSQEVGQSLGQGHEGPKCRPGRHPASIGLRLCAILASSGRNWLAFVPGRPQAPSSEIQEVTEP
jgi:hypothetical protein